MTFSTPWTRNENLVWVAARWRRVAASKENVLGAEPHIGSQQHFKVERCDYGWDPSPEVMLCLYSIVQSPYSLSRVLLGKAGLAIVPTLRMRRAVQWMRS